MPESELARNTWMSQIIYGPLTQPAFDNCVINLARLMHVSIWNLRGETVVTTWRSEEQWVN
jgi:hypothetical protein